ncbi:MAG TPA: hypothetical protein ENG10_04735 [Candidatus Bathyarchaeota archaeon]|nr:hypothetical protein [Candidatus Bathyarchaeota archaeon]HEX69581.1 hypothetical protein [Candidatus Bathyarchaeota archaeon]
MAVRIWYGTEADVYVQPKGSGAPFQSQHRVTCQITELSISGGDRDTETIHVLGEELSTNPCVSIQKELPQEEFEVELTLIKTDAETAKWVLGGTDTTEPIEVVGAGPRVPHRIIIDMKKTPAGGTEHNLRITFTDAYGVTIEKSVDAEGHIEETITFKCSAANYKEEYTSDTSTAPLPTPPNY